MFHVIKKDATFLCRLVDFKNHCLQLYDYQGIMEMAAISSWRLNLG
jgi:hypothetical protein